MISVAITAGAEYTAGELLRLLVNHPDVEIAWVCSPEHAGRQVTDIHQGLLGETFLRFTDKPAWEGVDLVFLCHPHGEAARFLAENPVPASVKIIDLSADHRLASDSHDFVYGLPELNRKAMVRGARHVANPGGFATAMTLSLLPLAKEGWLGSEIHTAAITGSTGEGSTPSADSHFSWRSDNVSVDTPLTHRHIPEVAQALCELQENFSAPVSFIPMRGPFARGILAVSYMDMPAGRTLADVRRTFEDYYSDHSFTYVSPRPVDLKDVVNTNKALIHHQEADGRLVITTVIDNLLKGASGTALHNMNLMFGLHERVGLTLKPSAF